MQRTRAFSILFFVLWAVVAWTLPVSSGLAQGIITGQSDSSKPVEPDPVLKPLLDVLKDEAARKKLIETLEGEVKPGTSDAPEPESRETIATQLAGITSEFQKDSIAVLQKFWLDVTGVRTLFTGDAPAKLLGFLLNIWPVFLVAAVSFATVLTARKVLLSALEPVYERFHHKGMVSGAVLVIAYTLAYIAALAIAYAVGNAFNAGLPGTRSMSLMGALYLNAFVAFGIARIVLHLVTGIVKGRYRLLRFPFEVERYLRRRTLVIFAILVFGTGFLVPLLNENVSFALGRAIRVLFYTAAAILSVLMTRNISRMLLQHAASEEQDDAQGKMVPDRLKKFLLWLWPLVAYAYIFYAYIVALTRPYLFAEFIGGATSKSLLAFAFGGVLLRVLDAASEKRVKAPEFLPLDTQALSSRLSTIAPIFFNLAATAIVFAIFAYVLNAWSIFDVEGWVETGAGSIYVSGIIGALVVFLAGGLLWAVITSLIDYRIKETASGSYTSARKQTLLVLLRNAITIAIVVFGTMIALSELGLDIGPLLAGAGVLGLAIGFGSQKLVQDIISGIFIQLENAMNVGDVVSVGPVTGVVERLTLRSVSMRDLEGVYHIVPFSSVDAVANYQRVFSYHVEEVGIAYKEDVGDGKEALQEAFHRLLQTEHKSDIIGPLEMHGVTALADSAVNIRARIKTRAGQQFALGRAYKELVKQVMDERNIEIPFPQTTIHLGRDKQGNADEFVVKSGDKK